MAKHVKSENQSGGITAETVNVDKAGEIGGIKKQPKSPLFWLFAIAAVFGIIAGLIAIIQFF